MIYLEKKDDNKTKTTFLQDVIKETDETIHKYEIYKEITEKYAKVRHDLFDLKLEIKNNSK